MRQTSILAYRSLTKDKLNEKQQEVLEKIEDLFPICDRQIAESLGWGINRVTPRRGELLTKGKIIEAYTGVDITGRKVTFWKPKRINYEYSDIS